MSAQAGGLMKIGEVAARNIALALNLGEEHVATIETAIKDEINAMSSHFTLAFADIQTQYEVKVNRLKSEWTYLKNSPVPVGVFTIVVLVIGIVVGHFA